MKVCFEKKDLVNFDIDELRKMLDIQIHSERFEGASVIRDIIKERKKSHGMGDSNNDDDGELQ